MATAGTVTMGGALLGTGARAFGTDDGGLNRRDVGGMRGHSGGWHLNRHARIQQTCRQSIASQRVTALFRTLKEGPVQAQRLDGCGFGDRAGEFRRGAEQNAGNDSKQLIQNGL